MKKLLTLFIMLLFVSSVGLSQTINFESYQNLKVAKSIGTEFKTGNVNMNFDEAYLSVSKSYDNFNFAGTIVLDQNYNLNLHSAYINYTNKLFKDVDFKVTGGKFINDWFNHTFDKNYTFTKNLIVNYPEFSLNGYSVAPNNLYTITDPGLQIDFMDINGAKFNVALFDVKTDGNKNIFSTLSYGNENLKGGVFYSKLIGDFASSKPMVFGGDLKYYTQINENPIAGGVEFLYYGANDSLLSDKYVAAIWGQFGLKSLPKWGLYTKWEYFSPDTKVAKTWNTNNTKGSLFITYTPNEILNLGLGYTYFWNNTNSSNWTFPTSKYNYEFSLKTSFVL